MEREQYIRAAVRQARAMGISQEASLDDIRRFAGQFYDDGDQLTRATLRQLGLSVTSGSVRRPLPKK